MNPPVVTTETLGQGQRPIVELDYLIQIQTNHLVMQHTYYFRERWYKLLSDILHATFLTSW